MSAGLVAGLAIGSAPGWVICAAGVASARLVSLGCAGSGAGTVGRL